MTITGCDAGRTVNLKTKRDKDMNREYKITVEDGVHWDERGKVFVASWRGYSACGKTQEIAIEECEAFVNASLAEQDED